MKNRKRRKLFGLTVAELKVITTLIVSAIAFAVGGALYFERKFASIDRRFEGIDHRFEKVEGRLDKIEGELKQTSNLLNDYLTWRFLYVNDPVRKHLTPRYDPLTRTLEFVDSKTRDPVKLDVRTPNEYDF